MKTRLRLPGEAWPSRPRTRARYLRVVVRTRPDKSCLGTDVWAWSVRTPAHHHLAGGTQAIRAEAMREALEWAVANAAVVEIGDRDIRRWARRASR